MKEMKTSLNDDDDEETMLQNKCRTILSKLNDDSSYCIDLF